MSDGRKYFLYIIIKNFYDFHEVPLTTAKGVFGRKNMRKRRKQITLAEAKKIMGAFPQRERTILLIMLQSGMEIGAVLNKFNWMWSQIKPQLDVGLLRVKVEFDDRKGNNLPYFTYFSKDAIQELRKWLIQRRRIIESLRKQGTSIPESVQEGQPIFITQLGTPYTTNNFYTVVHDRYALVMCHWERFQKKVVEDYIHVWQGSRKKPVKIAEVEKHIVQLNSCYLVVVNALDQHQSASTIQRLTDPREVRRICETQKLPKPWPRKLTYAGDFF